jgi:acetyl esterase/lipase
LLLKRYILPIVHRHSFFSEFQHFSVSVYFFNLNLNLKIIKFRIILILSIPLILFSCAKNVEKALDPSNKNARLGQSDKTDSLAYYASLGSPTREVIEFIKNGGRLPNTLFLRDLKQYAAIPKLNNTYPYACGDGNTPLIITAPPGYDPTGENQNRRHTNLIDDPYYLYDAYSNPINAIGIYGTEDDRQAYYIYCPINNTNSNSPIVVLVHGGGWFFGPNFDYVNGWTFSFSSTPTTSNFVKDLLNNGFIVVAPLYRLSRYGHTNSDIISNPLLVSQQIDDINSVISHIRNNFPDCFNINANSIQLLGESAGGHLALNWTYTQANSAYIKSVVSMYAPTNIPQYGNGLMNIPWWGNYICGNSFTSLNVPFYFPVEDITNIYEVYNLSNFNCTASGYPNSKILRTYNLIQSIVGDTIANPGSSSILQDISPRHILNSNYSIPTFIMHGKNDQLVPYIHTTSGMDTTLSNNGGFVFNYSNSYSNDTVHQSYSSSPKHGIKQYNNANHGWKAVSTDQATLYDLVRSDAIKWLNGHK